MMMTITMKAESLNLAAVSGSLSSTIVGDAVGSGVGATLGLLDGASVVVVVVGAVVVESMIFTKEKM